MPEITEERMPETPVFSASGTVKMESPVKKTSFLKRAGKAVFAILRVALPLSLRMRIVTWTRQRGLPGNFSLSMGLLRDFASSQPNEFHRFLWSRHLAYAGSYETSRFDAQKIEPSRLLLFQDIQEHLRKRGVAPERDVESVFDAGCSLGYVLRTAETQVFPAATLLHGVDVDRYAVEAGAAYLRGIRSKIELAAGDAMDLDRLMGNRKFDVVLCCGVLLYFDEQTAASIVKTLLQHTRLTLGLIGLAHPNVDNAQLTSSAVRARDRGFIHNLDAMIRNAGGRVVSRRWAGYEDPDGPSRPYFAVAEPN